MARSRIFYIFTLREKIGYGLLNSRIIENLM